MKELHLQGSMEYFNNAVHLSTKKGIRRYGQVIELSQSWLHKEIKVRIYKLTVRHEIKLGNCYRKRTSKRHEE